MAEYRVLHVRLEEVEPAIERRVRVDADASLFDLYLVLVNAMGWNDSHLHLFEAGEDTYSAPVPDIEPMGIDERAVTVR
ncbi:MAG: plasmid pRiA4b ORF-3 family protein, partial [Acidimicrobiia bacterium]|nr:plasmid pRiA4b ORF-3 family protein [Acidimicrobiia bacterium]